MRQRSLEAQLTPSIHSIGLLKEAIRQEEALLEADKRKLDKLEKDARAEESLRSRHTKNVRRLVSGRWQGLMESCRCIHS